MARDSFNETENVVSSTECTGILPALPQEGLEAGESAAQLYAIHAPRRGDEHKCAKKEKKRRSRA